MSFPHFLILQTCPVCQSKQDGVPEQMRFVDDAIKKAVQSECTDQEKLERAARIARVDAKAMQDAEKLKAQARESVDHADRVVPDVHAQGNSPLDQATAMMAEFAEVAAAAAPALVPAPSDVVAAPAARVLGSRSYSVDSSPCVRSKCRKCDETIGYNQLRLKEQTSSRTFKFFHLRCFSQSVGPFFLRAQGLSGLDTLSEIQRAEAEKIIDCKA